MLMALFADQQGEIFDATGYGAVGRSGERDMPLCAGDMIPLPEGATLAYLPGRQAIGTAAGKLVPVSGSVTAVAAILPAGYTRTHLPAFRKTAHAPVLPLYGYAAAAVYRDQIYVAAVRSDDNTKWHPYRYNTPDLQKKINRVRRKLRNNRIIAQLAGCSSTWHCCTAQNMFYRRWEAGIPVSPVCNANCFGCISLQPSECCPSPQNRIDFTPTPEEIAEAGIFHLSDAPEPIVSFGQGCEGEPSLAYENIVGGMKIIRAKTDRGLININTNAGFTTGIQAIVAAGLNSMRVSMISAVEDTYQAYYRCGYTLDDVRRSIDCAKRRGVFVSVNMLLFPGLNDRPEELAAWLTFIGDTGIDMIQLRNLNVDPDEFLRIMPQPTVAPLGVKVFIAKLRQAFPRLRLGSFSPYFTV